MGDISVRAISASIKLAPQKKTNNTSRPWWGKDSLFTDDLRGLGVEIIRSKY